MSVTNQAAQITNFNKAASQSNIIASGEFNLKDVAANVLTWATGCSAANTAPTGVVVSLTENDTYVNQNIPEVMATTTVVFNDAVFPNNLGEFYTLKMDIGLTEIYNNVVGAGFATNADYMDYVKTTLEALGYGIVIIGLNMTITDVAGNGANTNTKVSVIESRGENANIFTNNLTSSPVFGGGVTVQNTDFNLKQNGNNLVMIGNDAIGLISQVLFFNTIISITFVNGAFSNLGNYAIPVTVGTLNDFRIKIQILGVKID